MKATASITMVMIGLMGIILMGRDGVSADLQTDGAQEGPSYAGFSQIESGKNRFILVGDTQSTSAWEFWRERNDRERKIIIDKIVQREPAFVVHLGDITARGASKQHWQQFDDLHETWRKKAIPYFPILGNHDLYGDDETALQYYFGHFPHLEQQRWYSFVWKNIGLIMLDSNFSSLTASRIKEQARWYLKELDRFDKDSRIDYVIVCCHEPPYTNNKVVGPNRKSREYFADPLTRYGKPGLFFSGHSHSYERFEIGGKFFIVSGGGGGPRHRGMIDPGKTRYRDLFAGPELRFLHFCEIEIREKTLLFQVSALGSDGTFSVADSVIVPKAVSRE